jgi:hypothetical protein
MRYITKGRVIDSTTGLEYLLAGVEVRGNKDQIVVGGQGYCIEIRENKDLPTQYVLTLVTEESHGGSIARLGLTVAAWLKDFIYIGSEEI